MPYHAPVLYLALVTFVSTAISGSVTPPPAKPRLTSHLYVSSEGNDTADGLTAERPLRSLETARDKARTMQGLKTIYISGRFHRHVPLQLNRYDSNLTITSAPGASSIMIGDGQVNAGIVIDGAHHTTISRITLTSFAHDGILTKNATDVTIDHNVILNTRSDGWSQGAIHLNLSASRARITHNVIEDAGYSGIIIDTNERSNVDNVYIARNRVTNTCRKVADCGAIYINDRGRKSSGSIIEYNTISEYGNTLTNGRGIYLDDWASHVAVEHNSISGNGTFAFQIHGGRENRITYNSVNVTGLTSVMLYGPHNDQGWNAMTSNIFAYNRLKIGTLGQSYVLFRDPLPQKYIPKTMGNLLCLREICSQIA